MERSLDTPETAPARDAAAPYGFLPTLPRQNRGRTTQRVQEIIREAIVALAFTPGEFIQKEAICHRLGVSRFPVSEALGRLADEGFVEILPQRGTRVSRIDVASCRQALFIRHALEGEAVRVIATRANPELIGRLDENLAEQKRAIERQDTAWFFQLDLAFHDILLSELGYDRVKMVVEAARGSLDRMRLFLLRTQPRVVQSHHEHVAIVQALKASDPDAAQLAMRRHLDNAMDEIELRATENPAMFAQGGASRRT
jgi:DNA-binding GntR family transcriptional regulator